jgi:hypothetical protein
MGGSRVDEAATALVLPNDTKIVPADDDARAQPV